MNDEIYTNTVLITFSCQMLSFDPSLFQDNINSIRQYYPEMLKYKRNNVITDFFTILTLSQTMSNTDSIIIKSIVMQYRNTKRTKGENYSSNEYSDQFPLLGRVFGTSLYQLLIQASDLYSPLYFIESTKQYSFIGKID